MVSTFHYWNVHIQNTILIFSIALTNNIPFTMITKSSESVILIINVSMHVGEGSTICNWFLKTILIQFIDSIRNRDKNLTSY